MASATKRTLAVNTWNSRKTVPELENNCLDNDKLSCYPPENGDYRRMAETGFRDWRLRIRGLVEQVAGTLIERPSADAEA